MLNTQQLKRLNEQLPIGKLRKIQDHLAKNGKDLAKTTIANVLNGHSENIDVLEAAIAVKTAYQKKLAKLKKAI